MVETIIFYALVTLAWIVAFFVFGVALMLLFKAWFWVAQKLHIWPFI